MQKLSMIRKKSVTRYVFIACIVGILVSTTMVSFASSNNKKEATNGHTNYGDLPIIQPRTYYNATLFIVSSVYYVKYFDEEKIDLGNRYPFLPGIFIVETENGIQEFNLHGGWMGSRAEIYGFVGFFKWQGLYTVLIGSCTEISIIPIRGIE